jgi:hypothetical protein
MESVTKQSVLKNNDQDNLTQSKLSNTKKNTQIEIVVGKATASDGA